MCLTPRGRPFTQADARRLADGPGVILLCGRYEGIDQRVIDARDMEEISLGDYVLSGGEPAALVLLDAIVRLLPGVMGAAESAAEESFSVALLEYPHYTRPAEWHGRRCRMSCFPAIMARSPLAPGRTGTNHHSDAAPICGRPTSRAHKP